jgi:hypothetical protein
MENEFDKINRDLERYRFLLSANTDPKVDKVIRELIAEADARLAELRMRGGGPRSWSYR